MISLGPCFGHSAGKHDAKIGHFSAKTAAPGAKSAQPSARNRSAQRGLIGSDKQNADDELANRECRWYGYRKLQRLNSLPQCPLRTLLQLVLPDLEWTRAASSSLGHRKRQDFGEDSRRLIYLFYYVVLLSPVQSSMISPGEHHL
jgi:hypothetical protein